MEKLDAYRCAKSTVDRHCAEAPIHAAMRADELAACGDEAGRRAWLAILVAIDELGGWNGSPWSASTRPCLLGQGLNKLVGS